MDWKEWFINYLKHLDRDVLWDTFIEFELIGADQTSCCNGGPCEFRWGTDYIVFAKRLDTDRKERKKMKAENSKAILYIEPKESLTMFKLRECPDWIVCDDQELHEKD